MLSNLCSSQRKGPGTWLSLAVWVVYSNQETEGWTPHLRGWGKVTEAPLPASAHRLGQEVLIEERPVLSRRLLYHQ